MVNLYIYRLAKKDIHFNQASYRDNGTFHFTPGQEEIFAQEKYKAIRRLKRDIESLEEEREDILREMPHYRPTYQRLENGHSEKTGSLEKELQQVEEQLGLKQGDLERHKEDMQKRGVVLENEEPEQEGEVEKESMPKKKKWVLPVAIFLMYLVIEAFTYVTQIDSLRDVKSYEEIGSRVFAMFVLILLFHIVAHMARKSRKLVYNISMGFYLLMIGIMMFAPTTLHYIYPEPSQITDASVWALDETTPLVEKNIYAAIPAWVELYRKMEWAPAGLGILVFLIVFFVVPNPFFSKKEEEMTAPEDSDETVLPVDGDDYTWANTVWRQLKREMHGLRTKKGMIQAQIQQHKTSDEDLLLLRDKLESMEKKAKTIDQSINSKEVELEEFLKAIQGEINQYRAEYEDILSGDEVKQAFLKPEWPTSKDINKHFKIS